MNCNKCGSLLAENDKFCKSCGAAVEQQIAQNNTGMVQPNFSTNEINNFQQPMMQNQQQSMLYNQQQPMMYNHPQKNNNLKFILIGVGVVVVIAVILIVILVGNKKNPETNSVGSDSGNSPVVDNNVSTYTVNFKGFTFKIPTNLIYKAQDDSIYLGDESETWSTYIELIEGSFNQIVANKNQLQTIYQQQGFEANPAVEKTIGGMPFVVIEISKGGTNTLLGIAKANSMNLFGVSAYNLDNEYNYDILNTISGILKTAEYTGDTNQINSFDKIDISGISALAK